MRLNLREYTDPNDVAYHANRYYEAWAYMRYLDIKHDEPSAIWLTEEAEEHREWLVENVPWLVPFIDTEIMERLLRPADWILNG